MYGDSANSVLVQVPLTVSPFVSLPTATTLPYTYKSLPPTLPPSSTADQTGDPSTDKPKFITSSAGQATHPDDILSSCRRLQGHLEKLSQDAKQKLQDWEEQIQERELAEKRRLAPGWLDRNERILQPSSTQTPSFQVLEPAKATENLLEAQSDSELVNQPNAEGEELDRAFGAMGTG